MVVHVLILFLLSLPILLVVSFLLDIPFLLFVSSPSPAVVSAFGLIVVLEVLDAVLQLDHVGLPYHEADDLDETPVVVLFCLIIALDGLEAQLVPDYPVDGDGWLQGDHLEQHDPEGIELALNGVHLHASFGYLFEGDLPIALVASVGGDARLAPHPVPLVVPDLEEDVGGLEVLVEDLRLQSHEVVA